MGKTGKVRKTAKKIMALLKQVSEDIDVKCGAEIDLLPRPVVKLFFEIQKLHSLTKKEHVKRNGNRKKRGKRLHSNDESVSQRDSA